MRQGEDGVPVAEVCGKAGISQATYFNWKKKFSSMLPSEVKNLRALEEKNRQLKRLVVDMSFDKAMLQDVIKRKLLRPVRKRRLVDDMPEGWKVIGL